MMIALAIVGIVVVWPTVIVGGVWIADALDSIRHV